MWGGGGGVLLEGLDNYTTEKSGIFNFSSSFFRGPKAKFVLVRVVQTFHSNEYYIAWNIVELCHNLSQLYKV